MTTEADRLKIAVCEAMLAINAEGDTFDAERPWLIPAPIIPPTAIDWIGDRLVTAILASANPQATDANQ